MSEPSLMDQDGVCSMRYSSRGQHPFRGSVLMHAVTMWLLFLVSLPGVIRGNRSEPGMIRRSFSEPASYFRSSMSITVMFLK